MRIVEADWQRLMRCIGRMRQVPVKRESVQEFFMKLPLVYLSLLWRFDGGTNAVSCGAIAAAAALSFSMYAAFTEDERTKPALVLMMLALLLLLLRAFDRATAARPEEEGEGCRSHMSVRRSRKESYKSSSFTRKTTTA